jgi:thermitase
VNDRRYAYIRLVIPIVIATTMAAAMAWPTFAQPPLPPNPPNAGEGEKPPAAYAPGEILVKFRPTVDQAEAESLLAAQGLRAVDAIPSISVLKVLVKPDHELDTIASLRRDPNVLYAEPNYIAHALIDPDDTYYNPPYERQWGLSKIEAPSAWDITTGSGDIVIAVVDTGIDLDHPDFSCSGKLVTGKNFVDTSSPPEDDQGHGSHVAGIAAACTNNSTGVAGVAWGARLMPVKVLDSSGNGTYEWVANGITYAADHGADIVNLSLGGLSDSSTLSDAVEYAYNRGTLVVAAAGNCAQGGYYCDYYVNPIMYPAAYSTTLAVAATDSLDNWASFSEHHPYVDVAAPGVNIYSTVIGGYGYKDGTSMATPYVAGLAALIWSLDPSLAHDQVRNIIQITADDLQVPPGLGGPGKDDYTGYGRINAGRAVGSWVSLQTSPDQISFLIDGDSGPFPTSIPVQVTTTSPEPITWTTSISPSVSWLAITPPTSGTVSAASSDSFILIVPARPATYGVYSTYVVVSGAISSGGIVSPAVTEARITYLPDIYQYHFPLVFKNYKP